MSHLAGSSVYLREHSTHLPRKDDKITLEYTTDTNSYRKISKKATVMQVRAK
jgi:hypothetical protein